MSLPTEISFPVRAAISPLAVLDTSVDRVAIFPGVSALPPSFSVQFGNASNGNVVARDFVLSSAQWNDWGVSEDDGAYILACAAENIGFTVA
jgi:hypothetical protein